MSEKMRHATAVAMLMESLKMKPDLSIFATSWLLPSTLSLAENLIKAGLTPRSIKPARIAGTTREREYRPKSS